MFSFSFRLRHFQTRRRARADISFQITRYATYRMRHFHFSSSLVISDFLSSLISRLYCFLSHMLLSISRLAACASHARAYISFLFSFRGMLLSSMFLIYATVSSSLFLPSRFVFLRFSLFDISLFSSMNSFWLHYFRIFHISDSFLFLFLVIFSSLHDIFISVRSF